MMKLFAIFIPTHNMTICLIKRIITYINKCTFLDDFFFNILILKSTVYIIILHFKIMILVCYC